MLIAGSEFKCDVALTTTLNQFLELEMVRCDCVACRNFATNRQAIFASPNLSELLSDLGLRNPSNIETSFVSPAGDEALYRTVILIVGDSAISAPVPPEKFATSSGHEFEISDGAEMHQLDEGIACSFGLFGSHLEIAIPAVKIHEIELQIFVPWSIADEMPSFNPHFI